MSDTDHPDDEYKTPLQIRNAEKRKLAERLHGYRSRHITDEEVAAAMTGVNERPRWVDDLLFLLDHAQHCTLGMLAELVGVNRKQIMQWRRRYPPLEKACTDFLGAVIEEEIELPGRGIRPGILTFTADKLIPTFAKDKDGTLTPEDVGLLVRAILDSLRTRIAASGLPEDEQQVILQHVASDIRHEFDKRRVE